MIEFNELRNLALKLSSEYKIRLSDAYASIAHRMDGTELTIDDVIKKISVDFPEIRQWG